MASQFLRHSRWPLRITKAFNELGLSKWEDLTGLTATELLRCNGVAKSGLKTIRSRLRDRDLSLRNDSLEPLEVRQMKGGVYFLRCQDFVKIGCSVNVIARLEQYKGMSPFDCQLLAVAPCDSLSDAMRLEREYHELYADLRVRWEWFRNDDPLKSEIARLAEAAA